MDKGNCQSCGHYFLDHDEKGCTSGRRGAVRTCICTGFVIKPEKAAEISEKRINDLFFELLIWSGKHQVQTPKPEDIGATLEEFTELAFAMKNTNDLYYRLGIG